MQNLSTETLASIVTNNYYAAGILEKYHLDFCCGGKRTLTDACSEKGLDIDTVLTELLYADRFPENRPPVFTTMMAEQLVTYIVTNHHLYVKKVMPLLFSHLGKVAAKHGDRFPEMIEVFRLFEDLYNEMIMHMRKEEAVLFPAIIKAEKSYMTKVPAISESALINQALNAMETEHDNAGRIMSRIRKLTGNYQEPDGACTTFKLSLTGLKSFEEDLHRHVHLENNILFPMAKKFIE
jgi:regulator of cell morphogenesis and NO signaling